MHLNPKKLEAFRKKEELRLKAKAKEDNVFAWLVGTYTLDAMAVWWSQGHPKYPTEPRGTNNSDTALPPPGKGEVMTDGARFAAFAVAHNKQIRERRK